MSELLELARAEECRIALEYDVAEREAKQAIMRAAESQQRLLVLRQFINTYAAIEADQQSGPDAPERAQREDVSPSSDASEAGREGAATPLPATNTEAPMPLPAGHGHSATEPFTPEQQPAEAKTSGEEPLSSGSGGVQDRCESTPPPFPTPTAGGAPVSAPVEPDSGLGSTSRGEVATEAARDPNLHGQITAASPPAAKPPTLVDQVRAVNAEHPDWTARQIAEALGRSADSVASLASIYKIPVRKRTREERSELAKGQALARKFVQPATKAPAMSAEPTPAPSPNEPAPAPFDVGDEEEPIVVRPKVKVPKGQMFRLRTGHGEGRYLHQSGVGLVPGKTYAWQGTEANLLKLRQKFPDAAELIEEPVANDDPLRLGRRA